MIFHLSRNEASKRLNIELELEFLQHLEESNESLRKEDVEHVTRLLGVKSDEIRCQAAIAAGFRFSPDFEQPLIRLLRDKKSIVRVNACDSLSNSCNMAVTAELLPLMASRNRLERGYAMLSFSDIALNAGAPKDKALDVLKTYLEAEKDDWANVFGIEAAAQLGERDVLVSLYRLIGSKDHHARLVSVKCAERFAGEMDSVRLTNCLTEQLARETDVTIKGQIIRLLDQLNEK